MKVTPAIVILLISILPATSQEEQQMQSLPNGWSQTIDYSGEKIKVSYCRVPTQQNGKAIELEGLLYEDINLCSYRGIVVTHGRDGPHPKRNPKELYGLSTLNVYLAVRGFSVLYLVRKGYGNSEGYDLC